MNCELENAIGAKLAKLFKLKKDSEHKDRWQTAWGTKTNTGIFALVKRLGQEIESGEIIKTFKLE